MIVVLLLAPQSTGTIGNVMISHEALVITLHNDEILDFHKNRFMHVKATCETHRAA